ATVACFPTCCAGSPAPGPRSVAAALLVLLLAAPAGAGTARDLYEQACASCHGADGRGAPAGTAIAVPLPDFTDCVFATAETTANWIGRRGQVEVAVPSSVVDRDGRTAGVGDVALEYKHVLLAAPSWRTVVSGGLAVELPTGSRRHGVGAGTTLVTPQLLSAHAVGRLVAQAQIRGELPADSARAPRQMRYLFALQYPLGPYKKNVVPALELEQTQALDAAVHGATLLGPTLYLPLSRRGHVALGVGGQLPVAGVRPFNWQLAAFLLWEYRDGPFWAW